MSSRSTAVVGGTAVALFALAYLAPLTYGRGPDMDEGALVAYPARVLDGLVPHRDFLTFYGPGNLWILAGAFAVFGEGVGTERAVAMVYRLLIVLALFLIALRMAGVAAATLAGVIATVAMSQELVWAYSMYGALAFGLLGIALAASAPGNLDHRQLVVLLCAGAAGGLAVLIRFDFVPAVALGLLPLLTLVSVRARLWCAAGLVAAMALYAFHLGLVGPERIARVVGDLLASGPGRELPIPRPWGFPWNLLTISGLVALILLAVGGVLWRHRPADPVPRILVGVALFDLALLPYVLSRADVAHIRPVSIVPLSLLPALALYLLSPPAEDRLRKAARAGVVVVTLAAIVSYGDFTLNHARALEDVRSAYRGFLGDHNRREVTAIVARLRNLSRSGESVYVGPQDLRRTNYGPTYIYSMLPELRAASYYMEFNPGTATREGSGFADELRRADWLILTSSWDGWNEPNASTRFGSDEPNEVVREDFCVRLVAGDYRLYERCNRVAS